MSKRRTFTAAEKAKVALAAIKGEQTLAQIASKYELHPTQINQWKRQVLNQLPEAFTNKAGQIQKNHESELQTLYEQIGRLKIENDFLKKKCDLFA